MRIDIKLPLNFCILTVIMLVLKLTWNRTVITVFNVSHRFIYSRLARITLRRCRNKNNSIGKRYTSLRQTDCHCNINRRFNYRDNLRISKPDILAGTNHKASASRRQIPGFKKPCKIVKRCVRVRATHALLISGNYIVMLVALFIITNCTFLNKLLCNIKFNMLFTVNGRCCKKAIFNAVERLSHITAATD